MGLSRERSRGSLNWGGKLEPFTHPRPLPRGWGTPSPLLPPQDSLLERGALRPEVPVHLFTQGTLQSDPAGEQTILDGGCGWGVRV